MIDLSRRDLLGRLGFGAGLYAAIAMAPRSLLGTLLFEPTAPLVEPKPLPANPFVSGSRSLVAIVHGHDPLTMLTAGLEQLGGWGRLPVQGKRVLIKPNVVNDRPPPSTTNPLVVEAVIQSVRSAGAAEVIVADSSGLIRFPTKTNLEATGMRAAAARQGATVLALEDLDWVAVEPPSATVLRRYFVSKPLYEADLVINVPVIKTHRFAHYSCSLKNWVGIVHPRNRPSVTFLSGHWHERIAELNLAVHPHLTVADGTKVMIEGGPTSGTSAQADLLLISGDRVALDVVALALLRSYGRWPKIMEGSPWEQRQIKRAIELGLGAIGPEHLTLSPVSTEGESDAFARLVEGLRKDVGTEPT